MQKLKYRELLDKHDLSAYCPPENVSQKEVEAFHFVKNPIGHEYNFKPRILKHPIRKNSIEEGLSCSIFALSFFNSEENARNTYSGFPGRIKMLMGYTDIAAGLIKPEIGLCTPPDQDGHFDLYEFENVDLSEHMQIIGVL